MSSLLAHHAGMMAPRGVLWTPADLPVVPRIWVDWGSSVTDISGYAAAWTNRGSAGGTFVQSVSTYRPQIREADLAGKRVIRFDGTDDFMSHAGETFRNVLTGWSLAVYKKRTSAVTPQGACILYEQPDEGNTNRWNVLAIRGSTPGLGAFASRRGTTDATVVIGRTATDVGNWVIRRDVVSWGAGAAYMYVNGVLDASDTSTLTTGATSSTVSPGMMIGSGGRPASVTSHSDSDIAVVMTGAGSTLPSEANFQRMEGWAAWQLGLEGNLSVGHPYKTAPPYK